ncbi:hypothetical protein KIH74_22975 [Kineosporia sp. J2-2]|uniref:Terminase small subunit n=1 Tax=Kineosporia corallincola TaxID=2835133 RepID=A0ABS5TP39_9ACTN|nr:hypothetical protein [Kineosporia corallincola]MBT0771823.1 hypothetical protein [Kineosporia corallincola]
MAGRGPAPKPSSRRVRTNGGPTPERLIEHTPTFPRELPDDLLEYDEVWHPATIRWWNRWCESPLIETWSEVDWSELEACAVLHHEFMKKRTFTLASEIRLRVAKFGATPEDRARLRIVFADADEKDSRRQAKPGLSSRERLGVLKSLPSASSE